MAEIITMPRLSDTMEVGKVVKWYKKKGDILKEGDIIADIETDKAIQEFEIDTDGFLLYIGVKEGEESKVDDLIAIIGKNKDEDISDLLMNKNLVIKSNKNYPNIKKDQIIKIDDTKKNNEFKNNNIVKISPIAKKMIEFHNISISDINKDEKHVRITKGDVEQHLSNLDKNKTNLKLNKEKNINKVYNSSIRNTIASRLVKSKFSAPHYYLTININMDNCNNFRNHINKNIFLLNYDFKVSYNDIIVKAVSTAIFNNIQINSSWNKDSIIYHDNINIGIAVAINNGLLVPVIHNTYNKSLGTISKEIKDKINKSHSNKITNQELEGSTFTISNLGMYDIESFTSIINQPNSCILSVGSILKKPIIKNEEIIIGNEMKLTLACDHRVIDGVIGSKFLKFLKILLETPSLIFI